MIGYIYITTCLLNNKKYIGRKVSPTFLGSKYLGSGIHLKKAVKKYGTYNFIVELVEECNSYDQLVEREMFWINYYNAVEDRNFYNHSPGGYLEGFLPGEDNIAKREDMRRLNSLKHKGKKRGVEFSRRLSEFRRGKPSGMKGKHHTEKFKKEQGERTRKQNLARDPSVYQRVSESAKGNKMMNKDGVCKRIHPQDFKHYLSQGWVFGGLPRKKKSYKNKKSN